MTRLTTPTDLAESLLDDGYQRISEYNGLAVGSRVRHVGEQFTDAFRSGTGNVLGIFEKPRSSWSQSNHGARDIEIIVQRDRDHTPTQWANYHTVLVELETA